MATAYGASPALRLKRSSQSGIKSMTVAWQTLYEESSTEAFLFWAGLIDLTNMIAGDNLDVRLSKRSASGGAYTIFDSLNFTDAQPTNKKNLKIASIPGTYGIKIEMRQTVGALLDIPCEFYDAKRLGVG